MLPLPVMLLLVNSNSAKYSLSLREEAYCLVSTGSLVKGSKLI